MLERNLYNMLYENTKKFPKRTFIYFRNYLLSKWQGIMKSGCQKSCFLFIPGNIE